MSAPRKAVVERCCLGSLISSDGGVFYKRMMTRKAKSAADLHDAPLMQFLTQHSAAFLRKIYPPKGAVPRLLAPQEEYILRCLVSTGELMTACDQLGYALTYLSGYRRKTTTDGLLITRSDHLAYHVENFVIRLATITDRALKLVNITFQLGIQPRECRRSVVVENAHVAATPVRKRLIALDEAVNPHRKLRNRVVHQERYSDEALNEIEQFSVLEKSSSLKSDPLVNRYRQFYKTRADKYVKTKTAELVALANKVSESVGMLLESLLPIVESSHSRLSHNESLTAKKN